MPHPPDYYEILGVASNADDAALRRAYRRLAFAWHPDRRPGDANAAAQMRLINEANAVLSNPSKRRDYDLQRAGPRTNSTGGAPPRSEPRQQAGPSDYRRADSGWKAEWANAGTAPNAAGGTPAPRRSKRSLLGVWALLSLLCWPLKFAYRHPMVFSLIIWWGWGYYCFSAKNAGKSSEWWQRVMGEERGRGNPAKDAWSWRNLMELIEGGKRNR